MSMAGGGLPLVPVAVWTACVAVASVSGGSAQWGVGSAAIPL
jgi:hypothetical protein